MDICACSLRSPKTHSQSKCTDVLLRLAAKRPGCSRGSPLTSVTNGLARASFDLALSLTAESGDAALDAYVRAFRSQVRQTEGRPREALTLASQAATIAGASRSGRVPAWLRTRHALALAEVRDEKACLIVLAKAEEALGRGGLGLDRRGCTRSIMSA
jgi:hypothetical protein